MTDVLFRILDAALTIHHRSPEDGALVRAAWAFAGDALTVPTAPFDRPVWVLTWLDEAVVLRAADPAATAEGLLRAVAQLADDPRATAPGRAAGETAREALSARRASV